MIATQPEKVQKISKKSPSSSVSLPAKQVVKIPSNKPLLKGGRSSVFSALNSLAIKRWVAMEEQIVQGGQFREKNPVSVKTETPGLKSLSINKPKEVVLIPTKKPSNPRAHFPWVGFFFGAAFLAGVIFVVFYFKSQNSEQPVMAPLVKGSEQEAIIPQGRALIEKQKELETLAANQQEAIRDLKRQIQRLNQRLRSDQVSAQELGLQEADYRDELYQTTLQYEQNLEALRQANQVYEQDLGALRQANQSMEGLIRDLRSNLQDSHIALENTKQQATDAIQAAQASAVAATNRFSYGKRDPRRAAVSQGIRGKVVMINSRYQFAIISVGAQKGIRVGQRVTFYRDKKEFAGGKIERVFPTLSGVAVFDDTVLDQIQEGDKVAVSGY